MRVVAEIYEQTYTHTHTHTHGITTVTLAVHVRRGLNINVSCIRAADTETKLQVKICSKNRRSEWCINAPMPAQ